jgi:hypothetical protein
MDTQSVVNDKSVNKNRTLIIAVIVVVVLCGCLLAAAVGFFAFTTIRSEESSAPQPSGEFATPSGVGIGGPPSGGLGNDILKNDTWQLISSIAISMGCDIPMGERSTIEVLQEPDSKGVWYEKWTVGCFSNDKFPFEVEFILDDTGATFNIEPLQ